MAIWVLNRFLVQPWRREGHITSDGIFLLVCSTLFWLDPLYQYSRSWSNYNAAFVNLGSWAQLPGGQNDNAHLFPEALIFGSALYVAMVFGGMATGNWFMHTLGRRFPTLKGWHLAGACFIFLYAVDIVLEGFIFVRLGCYVFPAANGPMINEGHYYQFPLTYATCVVLTFSDLSPSRPTHNVGRPKIVLVAVTLGVLILSFEAYAGHGSASIHAGSSSPAFSSAAVESNICSKDMPSAGTMQPETGPVDEVLLRLPKESDGPSADSLPGHLEPPRSVEMSFGRSIGQMPDAPLT